MYGFFSAFQLFLALALLLGCLFSSTYGEGLYAVKKKSRPNTRTPLNVLGECTAYYPDPIELSEMRGSLVYAGKLGTGNWDILGVCTDFEPAD
jgi:hypothetical protein